jgi:type IV pilus assembly protein PilM
VCLSLFKGIGEITPVLTRSKQKSLVGLDIEAGSIAATEVSSNGRVEVARYGITPLAPGVFREGEVADVDALAEALKELFGRHKLSRNVRLGIANQRVAVRTLHLPPIENANELETAIRFQAQDQIPMPLEQAVLDWEVVGHKTAETGERRIEVVAVAARRDMLGSVMEALNRAGLRPVGIDLSAFGMIRALAGGEHAGIGAAGFVSAPTVAYEQRYGADAPGATSAPAQDVDTPGPARLYCNLGDVINLAVAQGTSCLFTRISPLGVEGIAQKLAERRQLTLEHAREWLVHVGLETPTEEIEGDAETVVATREALTEGASKLVDELRLSLEFYGTQEGAVAVEGVVACGPGTTIPGLVEHLQRDLGYPFHVARPEPLHHLDEAAAARLTLSYGLALEG